eukprot:scaffold3036_cov117-Cylindrotheca_fusiformis.AAC.9
MAKKTSNRKMSEKGKKEKSRKQQTPAIVDHVSDPEDEEIPEDGAFNSDDERLYGHFFKKKEDANDQSSMSDGDAESDSAGEAEIEGDDDGQYMLGLLDKLNSTSSNDGNDVSLSSRMMNMPESDYSNSISNRSLALEDLMETLHDTKDFKELQRTFQKQKSATTAPMEKVKADRERRKIAYEEQRKSISSWTKVVQENRQAESLDFKPKERVEVTRESLLAKFEPRGDFEKDLEKALEAAGQEDEKAVLREEERALQDDLGDNLLSIEEYTKRRGQLAQIRALMFYHEQKRHHMKKIKSKKYRRIRKKQRERATESALQAAIGEDENLAKKLKEKEEVSRIQERMTLAHKNTSKWAKRILRRGKNVDLDTRKALSAQLKRGDDLRKKMLDDGDGSESNSDEEDIVESARKVLADTEVENHLLPGSSGLFKLSFMQKGVQKQRDIAREEARKLLAELQANEVDDSDETEEGAETHTGHPGAVASKAEMTNVLHTGELRVRALEFGDSNVVSTNGRIELLNKHHRESRPRSSLINQQKLNGGFSGPSGDRSFNIAIASSPPFQRNTASRASDTPAKTSTSERASARTINKETSNPWMGSLESKESLNVSSKADARTKKNCRGMKRMVDIDAAVNILDSPLGEDRVSCNRESNAGIDSKPGDFRAKQIALLNQEELVRRAFATQSENEAEEEFRSEKEKIAAEFDPTRRLDEDKVAIGAEGWGSWAGAGVTPPVPRKLPQNLMAPKKQKEASRKRKDDKKPGVIINQKRLKKTANGFMLGDVPHPFSSRHEYEQAMLGGVGREWNVSGAFRAMIRPEILTRSGKIIAPVSKRAKGKRAPAKF